jgi:hypothetical protein
MNTEQKLEALIKFEGKISAADKTEAIRLARKFLATGELTLMEEMTVDSLAEIYDIKKVVEVPIPKEEEENVAKGELVKDEELAQETN